MKRGGGGGEENQIAFYLSGAVPRGSAKKAEPTDDLPQCRERRGLRSRRTPLLSQLFDVENVRLD